MRRARRRRPAGRAPSAGVLLGSSSPAPPSSRGSCTPSGLGALAGARRRHRRRRPRRARGVPARRAAPGPCGAVEAAAPHRPLAAVPAPGGRTRGRRGGAVDDGRGARGSTGAPGADRRGTGSHERGTDDPTAMPVTQRFTDTVPASVATTLHQAGRRRPAGDDPGVGPRRRTRRLDAEQDWRGTSRDRLLAGSLDGELPPRRQTLTVVSATGYRRRLPLRDAGSLLLGDVGWVGRRSPPGAA